MLQVVLLCLVVVHVCTLQMLLPMLHGRVAVMQQLLLVLAHKAALVAVGNVVLCL